jgi:hypothetical protein
MSTRDLDRFRPLRSVRPYILYGSSSLFSFWEPSPLEGAVAFLLYLFYGGLHEPPLVGMHRLQCGVHAILYKSCQS